MSTYTLLYHIYEVWIYENDELCSIYKNDGIIDSNDEIISSDDSKLCRKYPWISSNNFNIFTKLICLKCCQAQVMSG